MESLVTPANGNRNVLEASCEVNSQVPPKRFPKDSGHRLLLV